MANPLDPNTPMQPEVTASVIRPDMSEAEIKKKLYELLGQSMGEQTAQIQVLKNQALKEQAMQEQAGVLGNLDLRPFAQAAKGYGATNVAVPSEAPADRTALLAKLQNAVSEAQQGLTKEQVNALKSMMEDKRAAQAAISLGNQDIRVFENVAKKFEPIQKGMTEFYQAHDAFKAAIQSGDVGAIQSSLANYARMTGEKGPLSDSDIARTISPTFALKFAMLRSNIMSDPKTPVPEETLKTLAAGMDRLRQAAEDKASAQIDAAERLTSKGPGIYKNYSKDVAAETKKVIRSSDKKKPINIETATPEELKAYLGE
jgi:hypothetical protein